MKFIGKLVLYILITLFVVIAGLYFLLQTRWGAEHVSAWVFDGEFTVKRLLLRPRPALEPVSDSPEFRTLYPENICIFGVVTHVIHRTRELR